MTGAYYNEHDPFAAAWLRELITAGLIANGEVDERDIQQVSGADLRGFRQCHFFAGIGGWSYALRLAGWADDRSVWTGSCPCQGYSSAGRHKGAADARNLWPAWFRLICERQPHTIFGEQVANASGHGWLDAVSTELEGEAYSVGAVVLGAHSIGAPHIRQRLWWVANAARSRIGAGLRDRVSAGVGRAESANDGGAHVVGHASGQGLERLAGHGDDGHESGRDDPSTDRSIATASDDGGVGNAGGQWRRWESEYADVEGASGLFAGRSSAGGFWAGAESIACGDGASRLIESGVCPLADGVPARVGRLRGYGNAIVPQVAAEVIRAYLEIVG